MQFEKIGCWLLGKLFRKRGSVLLAEREGKNKKGSVLENGVNIQVTIFLIFKILPMLMKHKILLMGNTVGMAGG